MSEGRKRPPAERIIRHVGGVYFKDGTWTSDKDEATVFPTVGDALRMRRKLGLEEIELMTVSVGGRDLFSLS